MQRIAKVKPIYPQAARKDWWKRKIAGCFGGGWKCEKAPKFGLAIPC
jgi:hypothetical protein